MSDDFPSRQTIRLTGYDYTQNGYYFVTICSQNSEEIFGEIENGKMILNEVGKIVEHWVKEITKKFPNTRIDTHQVMPNHIHITIIIVGAHLCVRPKNIINISGQTHRSAPTLGTIIQWFKTMVTNEYINGVKSNQYPKFFQRIFQRNYYEHIIRSEREFKQINYYIQTNPENWETDRNNNGNLPFFPLHTG